MTPMTDEEMAGIVARATFDPFSVTVTFRKPGGVVDLFRQIIQAPLHKPPLAEDFIPTESELLRADIFPASRFDDMPESTRERYRAEYREFLLWRAARNLDKPMADLVAWSDYDPIFMDGEVYRWSIGARS